MFTVNSFSDVLSIVKTFGVASLHFAIKNSTLSRDANTMFHDFISWSNNRIVNIDSFNDGNNAFDVWATFSSYNVDGVFYTNLQDIKIIRTGLGSYDMSAADALRSGDINKETLSYVLEEIKKRNEARTALNKQ